MNNYFLNAYKYKETQERSQLENFTTESFIFILKYLISEYPEDAKKILSLFGIKYEQDLTIKTQSIYNISENCIDINKIPVGQKEAKPDIVIYNNQNKTFIIEVKVDSSLNIYNLKNGTIIDQYDFYKNLKNIERVYTLSKHHIEKDINPKLKIRWYQIYEILKTIHSNIVKEFCIFLEENGMGERKMIDKKSLDILGTVYALSELIKNSWEKLNIKNKKLNSYNYITQWGFGFYIIDKKTRNSATKDFNNFIGINKIDENNSNEIKYKNAITYWTRNVPKKADLADFEQISLSGYILKEKIDLEELIQLKDIDKQEQLLSNWLKEKVIPKLQ